MGINVHKGAAKLRRWWNAQSWQIKSIQQQSRANLGCKACSCQIQARDLKGLQIMENSFRGNFSFASLLTLGWEENVSQDYEMNPASKMPGFGLRMIARFSCLYSVQNWQVAWTMPLWDLSGKEAPEKCVDFELPLSGADTVQIASDAFFCFLMHAAICCIGEREG